MTDREKAGLRGPVRICVEETDLSPGKHVTATEFTPDGKLLSTRESNPDGSEWITAQSYDAGGRLVKTTHGKSGEPAEETLHSYDEAGRLLTIAHSVKKGDRTEFHYDGQGHKSSIQCFDRATVQDTQNAVFCGSPWDAATIGFGVPLGGTLVTTYNESGQPTEAQILDAAGRVVTHFVCTYNGDGRISEEKSISEKVARGFADQVADHLVESVPSELRHRVTPEEVDRVSKFISKIANAIYGDERVSVISYTYDAQGRLTTTHQRHMGLESTTTIAYNDHGEKAEVRHNLTANSAFLSGIRTRLEKIGITPPETPAQSRQPSPQLPVARFVYQYDTYGNWTQQTVSDASHPEGPSTVFSRRLTYY